MSKLLTGTVVSTKMQKTVIINVERKLRHPLYKKVITKNKKYQVHNELENIQVGDAVSFRETSPISKNKHFIVVEKLQRIN
jgi:small subunit ribosomal protein S17